MSAQVILSHPWFPTLTAAVIAVLVALVVHRIARMLLLRLTRPLPGLYGMVDKCRPAARWVLPLIGLQMVWQAAPEDLRGLGSVRHLNGLRQVASRSDPALPSEPARSTPAWARCAELRGG